MLGSYTTGPANRAIFFFLDALSFYVPCTTRLRPKPTSTKRPYPSRILSHHIPYEGDGLITLFSPPAVPTRTHTTGCYSHLLRADAAGGLHSILLPRVQDLCTYKLYMDMRSQLRRFYSLHSRLLFSSFQRSLDIPGRYLVNSKRLCQARGYYYTVLHDVSKTPTHIAHLFVVSRSGKIQECSSGCDGIFDVRRYP